MVGDSEPVGGPLVPLRQEIVEFYGDQLTGVLVPQGEGRAAWCVPLRPICTYLGLSWGSQRNRTMGDEVLRDAVISVSIIDTQITGRGHGSRAVLCLPSEYLPGWLFGINAGKVRPDLADKITRYRRECFRVLCEAFAPDLLPPADALSVTPDLTLATQAVEQARALLALAEQQLAIEQELARVRSKQDVMAGYVRGFIVKTNARLDALELHLPAGDTISEAQAAEIALAVKNLGSRLPVKSGMTGYQQVYAELYRRYGLSSYKHLPAARYQEALDWLRRWYAELSGAIDG
jgi:P22_AR N-terminal domain